MEIKGYRGENILRITGIVASAMIAAVTLVLDLRSTFLSIDWMFVAWIAAGILVVQLVWYIIYLSNVLASKAPRLVLTNIDTREGPIRDIKGACLAKFVDVQIANDPKHGTEQNHANGVSVQLLILA